MKKTQRLGQHFLVSLSVTKSIISASKITKRDTVLEIGTGKGMLVPFLCKKAKHVISYEIDKNLFDAAKSKFSDIPNLTLIHGDGFKTRKKFTLFISNLPYSKSKSAIQWLVQKKFSRAIIMVQKEFAEKLLSNSGKKRKAISVLANYATNVEFLLNVNKNNFIPRPKVDSSVIRLTSKKMISKKLIDTVNQLFSYRRKNLQNILKQFGKYTEIHKRLDDLSGDEIIQIAKSII